MVARSSM